MNQLIEQHCEAILRISKAHGVMDVREFGSMACNVVTKYYFKSL